MKQRRGGAAAGSVLGAGEGGGGQISKGKDLMG